MTQRKEGTFQVVKAQAILTTIYWTNSGQEMIVFDLEFRPAAWI